MDFYNVIHIRILKSVLCNSFFIVVFCILTIIVLFFFRKHEIVRKLISFFVVGIFFIVVCSTIFVVPRVNDIINNSYIVVHDGKLSYSGNSGVSFVQDLNPEERKLKEDP